MEYYYDYSYAGPNEAVMEEVMTGVGMIFAGVFGVMLLAVLAVAVATYVFRSLGLYGIAKRRGIRNPWMAWVPVLRDWIVGSISDQYQYVVKGNVKNKRTLLLALSVTGAVFGVAMLFIDLLPAAMSGPEDLIAVGTLVGVLLMIANLALNIVYAVFYYIAMYDLYTSCSPQNNVMFLVLSIVFRVTEPFFIFFNRKKDDGMPPRREAPAAPVLQEPAPLENWDVPDYL